MQNEDWLIPLIDNAPSEEKKLDHFIQQAIRVQGAVGFMDNYFFLTYKNQTEPIKLKGKFLPSYSETTKTSGYKSELKRTLLKGKVVKFKDKETLDAVAGVILKPRFARLRPLISDLRYIEASKNSKTLIITLSSNKTELLIVRGENKPKVLMKLSPG